jgi:hypothetical protein
MNGIFYVPDGLYRLLPGIYVVAGVLTLVYLNQLFAFISGALLISAGLLVFNWRSKARRTPTRAGKGYRERQSVSAYSVNTRSTRRAAGNR